MLIKNASKIVLKLGSTTVIDGKGIFKKKIKTKYEVVSVYSNKDLQKIKKLLIKYAN